MSDQIILLSEGYASLRSIADAIAMLRETGGFGSNDQAIIHLASMQLPSAQNFYLVQIRYHGPEKTYVVSMPSTTSFKAIRVGASRPATFAANQLDGATVEDDGHVQLKDGSRLRAVGIVPLRIREPNKLEYIIIHATIGVLKEQKRCYRRLTDKPSRRIRRLWPHSTRTRLFRRTLRDPLFINFDGLRSLKTPPLKELVCLLREKYPKLLKKVSSQKIADALQRFGVRIPTPRPRRSPVSVNLSATI